MKTFSCSRCYSVRVILLVGVTAGLLCGSVLFANPGKGKGKEGNPGHASEGSGDFVPPGHRRAPVEVIVREAPPAVQVEVRSAQPSPRHVWVAGYWTWTGDTYVWTPAVWVLPPEPAAVWVQPTYQPRNGVNIYITGYWRI